MSDLLTPVAAPEAEHRDRPRRAALIVLLVFFLLVAGVAVAGTRYYRRCASPAGPRTPVTVTIAAGASGGDAVNLLHQHGVIACGGIVGRYLLSQTGKASEIRAGTYRLSTNMTVDAAVAVLSTPPSAAPTVDFTVIPGQRMTSIAGAVTKDFGIPQETFLAAAESGKFSMPPFLPAGKPAEGFLYPQTYRFTRQGTTSADVIARLFAEFKTATGSLPWGNTKRLGITPYQAVIVASMIEKEVLNDADGPLVAAVIYNRLQRNMTLGFDTTVAYIDPTPNDGLQASEFLINSPYNTRLNPGLPPTPIASPGLPSLKAALTPATSPYLYFLQCPGEPRLRFSSTYQQFLADKAACLG